MDARVEPGHDAEYVASPVRIRFNCETAISQLVIPGRERSERTRNPYSAALRLWIPGSRFARPGMTSRRACAPVLFARRRVRRLPCPIGGACLFPRNKPEGMERQAAHQSSVLPRSLSRTRAPLGAPSRRFLFPGSAFPGFRSGFFSGPRRQFASSACRALVRPKPLARSQSSRLPAEGS